MYSSLNWFIIALLVLLIVINSIRLYLYFKYENDDSDDDDSIFGDSVDEQLKAQFKSVLLGQSVIVGKADYDTLLEQKVKLQHQEDLNSELKAQNQQLTSDHNQLQQQSKELEIQLTQKTSDADNYQQTTEQKLSSLSQEKATLQQKNEELQQALNEQHTKVAQLESQKQSLEQMRAADQERFAAEQKDLEHRLSTMGEKFLQERGESLSKLNNEHMGNIIDPLRKELTTFRELIVNTQKSNSEYAGKLTTELQHLQNAQTALSTQADQLTQALLQGNKSQGMWGELQLERVLEMSGLEKQLAFLREQSTFNSANQKIRADVIIPLPRNHAIIVDAKCSLTAYTDFVNADLAHDEDARQDALKRHVASVKHHVDELAAKDYQTAVDFNSPDFVFMFVPIDQALAVALKEDPNLYDYAQKKNIALISPSIAVPALRIVGELWISEMQSRRLEDLANMADKIYLKSCTVSKIFEKMLKDSDALTKDIDSLNTSLYSGRGNLIKMLENFKKDAPALTAKELAEIQQDLDSDIIAASAANTAATGSAALPEITDNSTLVAPPAKRRANKKALTKAASDNDNALDAIEATVEPAGDTATKTTATTASATDQSAADLTPEALEQSEVAIMEHAEQQLAQSRAALGSSADAAKGKQKRA